MGLDLSSSHFQDDAAVSGSLLHGVGSDLEQSGVLLCQSNWSLFLCP